MVHVSNIASDFMFVYIMRVTLPYNSFYSFFFNDTATTEIYTLSLHDALPILLPQSFGNSAKGVPVGNFAIGSKIKSVPKPPHIVEIGRAHV